MRSFPSISTRKQYESVTNRIARKGQGTKSLVESRGNASGRFKGSALGFPLYCLCTTKHSGAPAPAFKNRWCSTLYSCGRSADRYAISAARSSSPAACPG